MTEAIPKRLFDQANLLRKTLYQRSVQVPKIGTKQVFLAINPTPGGVKPYSSVSSGAQTKTGNNQQVKKHINNNNNNGRFYCHSDKDLQKSTVHWHKVINLFAYFSLLCLSSIQEPLHIWDRTLFMSLCKTPFQHKLFISPLFHSVGNLSFGKQ